jgi:predicted signal transduction protein with EAL and GGDEF domain
VDGGPGLRIKVTISIGVAGWNGEGSATKENAATLIQESDAALYRAKEGGRNRVECAYNGDTPGNAKDDQALEPPSFGHSTTHDSHPPGQGSICTRI